MFFIAMSKKVRNPSSTYFAVTIFGMRHLHMFRLIASLTCIACKTPKTIFSRMFLSHVSVEVFYEHTLTANGTYRVVNIFVHGQQMINPGCRPFILVFRFVLDDIRTVLTPPMGSVMPYLKMPLLITTVKIQLMAFWAVKKTTFVFRRRMLYRLFTWPHKVTPRAPHKKRPDILIMFTNAVCTAIQMQKVVLTGNKVTGVFARPVNAILKLLTPTRTFKVGVLPMHVYIKQSINLLVTNRAGESVFFYHVLPAIFL